MKYPQVYLVNQGNQGNHAKRYFNEMSVDEWIEVTDCPVQRDTKRHAEKAKKKHLKTKSRTQSLVSAAKLNNQLIKVDGHTRAFCWKNNWLGRPLKDCLDVAVYPCETLEEVIALYHSFDTQSQGKDSKEFTRRRFPAAIFAALLITLRAYGDSALLFWCDYSEDNGEKSKGECDGVQALSELLLKRKQADMVGGRNCSKVIMECALYCFETWNRGKWLKQAPRQMDVKKYLVDHQYPAWEDWS